MEGDPGVDFHEGHWARPMVSLSSEGDFCEKTHLNSAILSNAPLPFLLCFLHLLLSSCPL